MKHTLEPERCPGSRSEAHLGCQRCTGCGEHACVAFVRVFERTLCAGGLSPFEDQPKGQAPDPAEVRQLCDEMEPHWRAEPARLTILAAARAYLRLREGWNRDMVAVGATILAHRTVTDAEHDPSIGRFHGNCMVCAEPWPCDTAGQLIRSGALPCHRYYPVALHGAALCFHCGKGKGAHEQPPAEPHLTIEQVIAALDGDELRVRVMGKTNPGDETTTRVAVLSGDEEVYHSWTKAGEALDLIQIMGRNARDAMVQERDALNGKLAALGVESARG